MIYKFQIDKEDENTRLDKYLADKVCVSRSLVQTDIEGKKVQVNKKYSKKNYSLKFDDLVEYDYEEIDKTIYPQKTDLDIVYEDEYLAVINKAKNVIVHPSENIFKDTLVNYIMAEFENLSDIGGESRPGIVHRLDKDTSGLIIIAKDNDTHLKLKEMFMDHKIKKRYLCLVHGIIDKSGKIEVPIARNLHDRKKMAVRDDGRYSLTLYQRLNHNEDYSFVEVSLKTGRTHQIRVHMDYIGHPILGDKLYGRKKEKINLSSQMLHSYNLEFDHPITKKHLCLYGEPDLEFKKALSKTKLVL
ncbi:MAG: RluA family pseudouridine synthase [Finegoldia sp.]|nr:RluA family pseudouridine synthase [Finegoldia sp.]